MVCTVSFQSSKLLWAFVRFVSLWQAWQFSVAISLPSPSGKTTGAALPAVCPGALGAPAALGEAADAAGGAPAGEFAADAAGAAVAEFAAGAASCGPKFLTRYAAKMSTLSSGMVAPRSIMVWMVSFQSSRLLCALVKFVSRWHIWQYSVAMGLPSPSGSTTGLGAAVAPEAGAACPAS